MKRFALAVVALALVAAACGDAAGDVPDTVAPTTVAPTTTTTTLPAPTTTAPAPTTTVPPTTVAPTTTTVAPTTTAPPAIVPGEDPDVDAVVEAYAIAFDSVSDFATKAPYIEDPTGLEGTIAEYNEVGERFGGIAVVATRVTIDADEAEVGYDLYFGGNPTYPNLTGSAVKTAEGWKVPRSVFCTLMRQARVGCPTA